MVVDTLLDRLPPWVGEETPDSALVLHSHCTLVRNLADFPFPNRCSDEEKLAVTNRVVALLDSLNMLANGRYYALQDLTPGERRFLAERNLVTIDLLGAHGPRGVYVTDDQRLSIMVNSNDHLCMRVMLPGLQLDEAWSQLNLVDDTLSGVLDYAYSERLGFLTAGLGHVGTGLKAGVMLHLGALADLGSIDAQAKRARDQHLFFFGIKAGASGREANTGLAPRQKGFPLASAHEAHEPGSLYSDIGGALCCEFAETLGDLFLLVNQSTLGVTEAETIYQVRQCASDLAALERQARGSMLESSRAMLEDRVGRSQGIASGARLLEFPEAVGLLSSLRLGVDSGLIDNLSLRAVNGLMLHAQGGHLRMESGKEGSARATSAQRADLFRRTTTNS